MNMYYGCHGYRCDVGTFDGDHPGQQVQMLSLRTHLESLLKNTIATDSVPSVQVCATAPNSSNMYVNQQ